jgi:hypothetical protein
VTAIDPETEHYICSLENRSRKPNLGVLGDAAAHMRKLATDLDGLLRDRKILLEHQDKIRAERDAAQRELRETKAELERLRELHVAVVKHDVKYLLDALWGNIPRKLLRERARNAWHAVSNALAEVERNKT